jgi:hypothetical protein
VVIDSGASGQGLRALEQRAEVLYVSRRVRLVVNRVASAFDWG